MRHQERRQQHQRHQQQQWARQCPQRNIDARSRQTVLHSGHCVDLRNQLVTQLTWKKCKQGNSVRNSPTRKSSRQMAHCFSSADSKQMRGRKSISDSLRLAPARAAPICKTLLELCIKPLSSLASQLRMMLSSSTAKRRKKPVMDSSSASDCDSSTDVLGAVPLRPTNGSDCSSGSRSGSSSPGLEGGSPLLLERNERSSSASESSSVLLLRMPPPCWIIRKNSRSSSVRPTRADVCAVSGGSGKGTISAFEAA
mmetsp:Transcript_66624/g.131371  ORF Transcript_66624/g.131371 Transcript_66624/m.131371 type:complete len:254 (+) Transcript_66624:139-900(+)